MPIDRRRLIQSLAAAPLVAPLASVAQGSSVARKAPSRAAPEGYLRDQSFLEYFPTAELIDLDPSVEAAIQALRKALATGSAVAVGGARHSMGGQSIARDGVNVETTRLAHVVLAEDGRSARIGAGALWKDVIRVLDAKGKAVAVMQSDADFTLGGSLSVNVHGWQVKAPPIGGTVRRVHVLTPEGDALWCSASENADLYRHVLGGYGLFGVILEAELDVVDNELYRAEGKVVAADDYIAHYEARVLADPACRMAYGRLRLDARAYMQEALAVTFSRVEGAPPKLPTPAARESLTTLERLERAAFRASEESKVGKNVRWGLERIFAESIQTRSTHPRNAVMTGRSKSYLNIDPAKTDLLQEYFLPFKTFNAFLKVLRREIPASGLDLLNVTLREVQTDARSAFAYAREPVMALVLFYTVPRTPEADARLCALTRTLNDAALDLGGSFYLPYRLHATRAQIVRAYPAWGAIDELKRRFDPKGRLSNELHRRVLRV